ncbi:hypothetical protein BDQ17DRAFT_1425786 [Cyathus striatus]|nr:hypothetical protein BDQ17DRAFT_1425786 [Cyathus striatus]
MHGGYRSISSERPLDVLYRLTSSNVESISFTGSEFLQDDLATLQGISWKKITTLCLEGKIDVLLSVVRHCRLLQTLKINARSYLGGMIQRYGTLQGKLNEITLPNLTSLCLLMDSSLYISELIGSLKLPSLKTLDYHLNGQSYEHVPSPIIFCDTLKRLLYHADNLESLRIHSLCCSSHDDLVQILQMTPHLRLLNFSWKHTPFHRWRDEFVALDRKPSQGGIKILNDDLLEALSPLGKQQSEIICPDLQTFECYEGMRTSFTKKAVKEFVQKRRDPNRDYRVSALRDVRVSVVSPARCESLVDFGYWESKLETGRFMPREGLQCWRDAGRPYRFLGYDIISL